MIFLQNKITGGQGDHQIIGEVILHKGPISKISLETGIVVQADEQFVESSLSLTENIKIASSVDEGKGSSLSHW